MEIKQVQDSRNQHIVAVEHNGEFRCFFTDASLHTAGVALENLRRDIARHGESVVGFDSLPKLTSRTGKSGRAIYDIEVA